MTKQLPMSEATLTIAVLKAFRDNGWLTFHMHSSARAHFHATSKGFPDILALRGDRLVLAELKAYSRDGRPGRLSAEQKHWLEAWRNYATSTQQQFFTASHGGCEVYQWEPDDLRKGLIDKVAA